MLGTGTYFVHAIPLYKLIFFSFVITRGHSRVTYSVCLICSVLFGLRGAKVGSKCILICVNIVVDNHSISRQRLTSFPSIYEYFAT